MNEHWLSVLNYEGLYEVSNLGHIRSLDHNVPTKGGATRLVHGRILKCSKDSSGYLICSIYKNGDQKQVSIHRMVLEVFIGPCPEGMECRHLDGNKLNNRLNNLKWGTYSENQNDRHRHGTITRLLGENSPVSFLTKEAVLDIRTSKEKQTVLMKKYNTSQSHISNIQNNRRWEWL
jgi:hypothetical protein